MQIVCDDVVDGCGVIMSVGVNDVRALAQSNYLCGGR